MGLTGLHQAFPDLGGCHFLNWAGTGVLPRASAEVFAGFARQGTEPMSTHFDAWFERVEQVRALTADTVGAAPGEIAFVPNTSTALSLIAAAVDFKRGDKILFPADEFPSNRFVWQNLAALGVEAVAVPIEAGKTFARQLSQRSLDGVRLVAFSAVSYRDGRREDPREVASVVRATAPGCLIAVDAIQAVGAVPFRAADCDFVACGGQKWLLGPAGSGFLYIAARRLEGLHMPLVGWASARDPDDLTAARLEFRTGARRLEPGFPDVAALAAFGRSLELLHAAGLETVTARVAELESRLRRGLQALGLATLNDASDEYRSGIVTAELPSDWDNRRLATALEDRRVFVTLRDRLLRASPHAMTREADIEALLGVLESFPR